jgi:PAS domain S-box-containing protein
MSELPWTSTLQVNRLFDLLDEGLVVLDNSGVIVHSNQAFADSLQYSVGDLLNSRFDDLIAEEQKGSLNLPLAANSNQPLDLTLMSRERNPRETSVRFLGLIDGEVPKGFCLIINDRDDRCPEFKKIVSSAHLKMVVIDTDYNVTYVNPAFSMDAHEIIGTPVVNGVGPEYREAFQQKLETAMKAGTNQEIEICESLEGKPPTWHVLRIGPIREDSKVIGAVIAGYEITDRINVMRALQESEEKFRGVFEHANDAITLANEEGRIVAINAAQEKLFGIKREDVIGMHVWELQVSMLKESQKTPEYQKALQKALTDFFEKGTAPWLEKRTKGEFIHPLDGSLKTFEQASFRIPTSKGYMLCSFGWDITEETKTQAALDEARERYELALKGAELGVWDWNAEDDEMIFSSRYVGMLGYTLDEIEPTYAEWEKLVHPDDIESMEARWNDHVVGNTPLYSSEHRMRTKAGGWKWVLERGRVVELNEAGGTKRATGTLLDITERKVIEKALMQSEEKYRTLLVNLPQRVFYKNRDSVYIAANPAFVADLGLSPDEVVGKTDYDFYPKELADTFRESDRRILETLENYEQDEHHLLGDDIRYTHIVKVPVRDDEGNVMGILGIFWDITENTLAAQALKESETNYRNVVEQSLMGIAIVPRGFERIAFVNPKICDILGYSQEELLGLSAEQVGALVHPDDVDQIRDYLNNRLKETDPGEPIQVRMFGKDGSAIWADFSAGAIEYDDEPAVQVSVVDITKRIEAEMEVLRDRQVFRAIAEGTIQATDTGELSQELLKGLISSLDFDFGTFRFFDEKKNVLRYSALVGIEISDTRKEIPVTSENAEEYIIVQTALKKTPLFISNIEEEMQENPYLKRLKELKALSAVAYPILDDDQLLLGVLSLATHSPRTYTEGDREIFATIANMLGSVLERKKAEKALQISERRYRELLTNISEGMTIADLDENILFVNSAFCDMLGYSQEELVGTKILDIIAEDDIEEILAQTELRRDGKSTSYSHQFVRKDGEHRIVRTSAVPSRDDDGQVDGSIAVVTDITERILKDREIQKLNEELARRVEERTAELAAANQELEAFSYSVSHDLRAPLRTINGFSQALLEDYSEVIDDTGQDFLRRVRSAATHMGSLIEDVLVLSRVTRAEMDRADVNLSKIAREIIDDFREVDPEREVDIEISDNVRARCDQRLIKLVIQNLLDNAWKFTSKLPKAQIEFSSQDQEGEVVFFVKDNGAGFNMEYKDKLFIPFQRLHQDEDFEGSGIGLATVQRIINRHGGRVWAESELDTGSTFYFTIPESRSKD